MSTSDSSQPWSVFPGTGPRQQQEELMRTAGGTGASNPALIIQMENLRRVLNKMHRELEPGNDAHSTLIDLVNHADTLAQYILTELGTR